MALIVKVTGIGILLLIVMKVCVALMIVTVLIIKFYVVVAIRE